MKLVSKSHESLGSRVRIRRGNLIFLIIEEEKSEGGPRCSACAASKRGSLCLIIRDDHLRRKNFKSVYYV